MNYQKGFVVPLLLLTIAVLVIGGGVYVYQDNKQSDSSSIAASTTTPTVKAPTTQTQPLKSPAVTTGTILLGDKAFYKNLTSEQKAIIIALNASFDVPAETLESYVLKYYDSRKIIFGNTSTKTILPLVLLERNSWKYIGDINCKINVNGGYFESQSYLIGVSDSGVCYYKLGDATLTLIPDSLPGKGETYVKNAGALDYYDVSFNEATKVLSAGVFRAINDDGPDNPKLRTVQFTLK